MTDQFNKLDEVKIVTATPSAVCYANIAKTLRRNLPKFHEMKTVQVDKGDMQIALVGGGPSLKNYIEKLRLFDGVIVACGSVHDYLVENNIIPHFCVVCDPDPISAKYLSKPCGTVIYLLATQCDEAVFDKLKHCACYVWHHYSNDDEKLKEIDKLFEFAVGGGCTVGLRALSIAMIMKFRNIHFYGFDSCVEDNNNAYAFGLKDANEVSGPIYDIKFGPEGKTYKALGYHIAQVTNFKDIVELHGHAFDYTFHGDGLLPEMMNQIKKEVEKLKATTSKEVITNG